MRLGASWVRLGPSAGRLGASWRRFVRHAILDAIFQSILVGLCIRKSIPEFWKIVKFYWKNSIFLLSGCFNIRALLDKILVPTWFYSCTKKPPKSRLGGVLRRLLAVLEAS